VDGKFESVVEVESLVTGAMALSCCEVVDVGVVDDWSGDWEALEGKEFESVVEV